ncbi:MAG: 4Fe-4S dicluster domain-containing protein, partial [Verrucomicrobiota bacterium]
MQHEVPTDQLGPAGPAMTEAIQACVHCGFCLPACPTYQELRQEMDSPRGRIFLMKEVLENRLDPKEAEPHIDRCLGCLACEPACPSGVPYRNLISPFRALQERTRKRGLAERLKRTLLLETLPYPKRFRFGARLGCLTVPFRSLLPGFLRPMVDLLPPTLPPRSPLSERVAVGGQPVARVALLKG